MAEWDGWISRWDKLAEFDVPVPGIPGIGNFSFFWWYRKKLVPEKSLGTGIGKIWYRKKVPEPVSEKFGTGKKYRYRYRLKFWVPSIHEKKGLLWRRWFFSKILIKSLNLAENPYKIPKFGGKTNYIQKIGGDIISRNSTFFMYVSDEYKPLLRN